MQLLQEFITQHFPAEHQQLIRKHLSPKTSFRDKRAKLASCQTTLETRMTAHAIVDLSPFYTDAPAVVVASSPASAGLQHMV